jgi:hypothetical protein
MSQLVTSVRYTKSEILALVSINDVINPLTIVTKDIEPKNSSMARTSKRSSNGSPEE